MINNRQGGRRRGRGGQRGQNLGGQPGNRQDNRQRGNAAQLLEKYKNMARDSQLAGDRVQTEYYLQYADHYFRVLSESRSRYEEQRPQRGEDLDDDDGDGDGDGELMEAGDEQADAEAEAPRRSRNERVERNDRPERSERPARAPRAERSERFEQQRPAPMNGSETIPFDALPPSIGREEPSEADVEEPAPPRRRTRRPRATEGDDASA